MATVIDTFDWNGLAVGLAQLVSSIIKGGPPAWIVTAILTILFTFLFWKFRNWVKELMWKRTQENTDKKEADNRKEEQQVNQDQQEASDKTDQVIKDDPVAQQPKEERPKPPRNVGEDEE